MQERLFDFEPEDEPDNQTQPRLPDGAVVVRVLIDEPAIDREFDYWVDGNTAESVRVGSIVRVDLRGRRVRGWVVERDIEVSSAFDVRKISKLSSLGPPPAIIDLCRWAARRWVGSTARFMRTASPPTNVDLLPRRRRSAAPPNITDELAIKAFDHPVAIVRISPTDDDTSFALAAAVRGRALILTPSIGAAQHLALRLRRAGVEAALWDRDWAASAAGAVTVGTRAAAFAPIGPLDSVVVLDEHDERYQEESSPTWHARTVALERARRDDASCVLVSPVPSLEALSAGNLVEANRRRERDGWPAVEIVDRRGDDPALGEWCSPALTRLVTADRSVACVINRKGRARLCVCSQCGEVARTVGGRALILDGDALVDPGSGESRPVVCSECGSTRMRRLRLGVGGVAEELAALTRRSVTEVSAAPGETNQPQSLGQPENDDLFVGTEALLYRVESVDVVVFLDIDQELLAPRFRAGEQALALIARAARLVGPKALGGRIVVQTRMPEHPALRAAALGDPTIFTDLEMSARAEAGLPPHKALAVVSGAAAEAFMAEFEPLGDVEVVGSDDGSWLLRSGDHNSLTGALRATQRPPGRLRIEVDPARA
ncbi:MAG: hypothetical protein GY708_23300 [Actinomycetia bacterium]|nr:hypothetical protein [Actinomycetes bacterium]MCP4958913.1 hypothetical protein [Actinomycetes bacterium]